MRKVRSRIIVTGGAGFIGSHLTKRLLSEGHKVTVLDNLSTGKEENLPPGADFIKIDLGMKDAYSKLKNLKGTAIFHLAGQSSAEISFLDPLYDLRSHVLSTFWLLQWARERNLKRFLYASSMGVYGKPSYLPVDELHPLRPLSFYAAAKISAESYIKLYQTLGIHTTIFRLFNVYGPGQNLANKMQGMVSIYLSFILESLPITIKGSSERFRDFIYIDDVVEAWWRAFSRPVSYGKIYNLASGEKSCVRDLINILKTVCGSKGYPVKYRKGTPGDQFGIFGDISLISKDLDWKPKIDLETGCKIFFESEKRKIKNVRP